MSETTPALDEAFELMWPPWTILSAVATGMSPRAVAPP